MTKRRTRTTSRTSAKRSKAHSDDEETHQAERVERKTKKPKLTLEAGSGGDKPTEPCQLQGKADVALYSHAESSHVIQSPGAIRRALLRWFADVYTSRAMPWRKLYNPLQGPEERSQRAYEVWVSEIMLQQTQVSTVIPYYDRWMKRFPTIRDLAAADIDEVNSLWKGLGYYSRASRLLSGAQKAVAEYNGRLPDNAQELEAKIPGIGRYSAGAISSIAYGESVPVLDGNVHRLMSRFLAVHAPPKLKATLDILWAAAAAMVRLTDEDIHPSASEDDSINESSFEHTQYPGDINQALIELGSTVCKVRDPHCETCPLRTWCRAYQVSQPNYEVAPIPDIEDACTLCHPLEEARITAYPMKVDRKKPREELDIVNVVEWRSTTEPQERWFLMVRRPDGGLLAGLYEFPTSSNVVKPMSSAAQYKTPQTLLSDLLVSTVPPFNAKRVDIPTATLQINSIKPVGDVIHVFSHIKKTYRSQWVILQGGKTLPTVQANDARNTAMSVSDSVDGDNGKLPASFRKADAMWVRLNDVPNINMGTGHVKVWNLAKKLWEGNSTTESEQGF